MAKLSKLYFKFRNYFAGRWPQIYYFCEKHKMIVKSFFSGSLAGIVDFILLFVFFQIFRWPIVLATSAAFLFSFGISFTLQKLWTFRDFSQSKAASQLTLYILNAFIGLNLNGFFMHLLVNQYHIWYLLAQLMVNAVIGLYNFFIYRHVVFRKDKGAFKKDKKNKKDKKDKNEINYEQKTVRGDARDLA